MITFTVPLPPPSLRANSRAHWATKKQDADAYSVLVGAWTYDSDINKKPHYGTYPWEKAHVTYTWRSCGVQPDHGNLGGNTKYLQDILCMAPRSAAGRDRWYLGLCADDKGITASYVAEKCAKKADECVVVTIEEIREGAATEQMRELREIR